MKTTPHPIESLNWNQGQFWMLLVEHIVVFSYPFPLTRFSHSHAESLGIWWIRSGKAEAKLDGKKITLSKGDMVFFTPEMKLEGEHHPLDPIELVGIRFSFLNEQGIRFYPDSAMLPRGHYKYLSSHSFDQTVLQLLKIWRHSLNQQTIHLHSIGLQIIGIAYSHNKFKLQSNRPEHLKYKGKIMRIIDLIQEHYAKSWTTEDLAREVDIQPTYLTKLFKRITGTSLKHYIVLTRLRAAESYLSETNMLISEIAQICGYKDPYFFSRHFKRVLGLTPSEYRQELTEKDPIREKLDRIYKIERK